MQHREGMGLAVFAQQAWPGMGLAALVQGLFCVLGIAVIAAANFYPVTLHRAMNRCAPRNRTMSPALVWLAIVPILHFYWWFVIPVHLGKSLKNEFSDRDLDDGGHYGKRIGVAAAAACVAGIVLYWPAAIVLMGIPGWLDMPPGTWPAWLAASLGALMLLSMPTFLASIVLWIVYWVKIAGYSRKLGADRGRGSRADSDEDRPRLPAGPEERIR
jgi:hypothetical protein